MPGIVPLTDEIILDLDQNSSTYRYARDLDERRRVPRMDALIAFAEERFNGLLSIQRYPGEWRSERKHRRIVYHQGPVRKGEIIRFTWNEPVPENVFNMKHLSADPSQTNWDVVSWLARSISEVPAPGPQAPAI